MFTEAIPAAKVPSATPLRDAARDGAIYGVMAGLIFGGTFLAANLLYYAPFQLSELAYEFSRFLGIMAMALAVLTIAATLLWAVLALPFRFSRSRSATLFPFNAALIGICIVSVVLTNVARVQAYSAFAKRSQPVVDAILNFEANTGRPPRTLDELVPEYLAKLPTTGFGPNPNYNYVVTIEPTESSPGHWELSANTMNSLLGAVLVYDAKRDYQEKSRYGDWVYFPNYTRRRP